MQKIVSLTQSVCKTAHDSVPAAAAMSDIILSKRTLRTTIRALLREMSPEHIAEQSACITKCVLQSPEYQAATSVAIFLSMPKEFQTFDILQNAFASNKRVFVPYIFAKQEKHMEMIEVRDMEDISSFQKNSWGIPEPSEEDALSRTFAVTENDMLLDFILVPGLAFDRSFNRLGQGKGYYGQYSEVCYFLPILFRFTLSGLPFC